MDEDGGEAGRVVSFIEKIIRSASEKEHQVHDVVLQRSESDDQDEIFDKVVAKLSGENALILAPLNASLGFQRTQTASFIILFVNRADPVSRIAAPAELQNN